MLFRLLPAMGSIFLLSSLGLHVAHATLADAASRQINVSIEADDAANLLAGAYVYASNGGVLRQEGLEHLRELWKLLDNKRGNSVNKVSNTELSGSLVVDVTLKLNEMLSEKQLRFESQVFQPLRCLVRIVCWEFKVEPIDIEHSLHSLEPPDDRVVTLFGIDLGNILGKLLGAGGETRARFQLVVLANRLWRDHSSVNGLGQDYSSVFWVDVYRHLWRVYTLYLTVMVCRYVPILLSYLCYRRMRIMLIGIYHLIRHPAGPYPALFLLVSRRLLILLSMMWLTHLTVSYRSVMLSRVALLTVRLHRGLVYDGLLGPQDYTQF